MQVKGGENDFMDFLMITLEEGSSTSGSKQDSISNDVCFDDTFLMGFTDSCCDEFSCLLSGRFMKLEVLVLDAMESLFFYLLLLLRITGLSVVI